MHGTCAGIFAWLLAGVGGSCSLRVCIRESSVQGGMGYYEARGEEGLMIDTRCAANSAGVRDCARSLTGMTCFSHRRGSLHVVSTFDRRLLPGRACVVFGGASLHPLGMHTESAPPALIGGRRHARSCDARHCPHRYMMACVARKASCGTPLCAVLR